MSQLISMYKNNRFEWSLEKEPLAVGEKVHVLIYRIYAVDSGKLICVRIRV